MKRTLLFLITVLSSLSLFSQQPRILDDPNASFHQAKEYFQKEHYSLAYPIFRELELQLRETDRSNQALNAQEIRYYTIVCALKQNEEAAIDKARDFIDLEDNTARVEMMSFHLAEYYFRNKDYNKALSAYETISVDNLSNREVADMKFHQGYAYFTLKQFNQAKPLFDAIRQLPKDPNYIDANYYYGFISFYEKKYAEAQAAFKVVEDHPSYRDVVPYYVANIYLIQGQKDKAIEYAEARLKKPNQYYDLELRKLVGHGYFEKGEYDKALPYLEAYISKSEKVSREDLYELSYSYYVAGNYNKAIEGFKQLGGKEDSLAQHSMYLLGDAYLKTNQKANARNAFLFSASNSSNAQQKEIASYNYAKLSYELGYQDVALTELQKFLDSFPSSSYQAEARELMVGVLANTNNYKDALTLMEGLNNPSENAKRLYPRILYGRATEYINDGMLVSANELLDKVLKDPYNASVLSSAQFWKGEISYRLGNIDDAIRHFFDYLKNPVTNGEVNPTNARYNLGYAFLKKENYRQALGFFEQIVKTPQISSSPLEQDAYIRSADCYYMQRDFKKALSMYDVALKYSWPSEDYALFQKAMVTGVTNSNEKINLLKTVDRRFPTSSLVPDANMEIANTYMSNENYREAIPFYKNVITAVNSDALKPRAYLRSGIAYYNLNNNAEALKNYNALLTNFPNSAEAEEGLENARIIYIEEGRTSEYVNFAKTLGKEVSTSMEDSLAYAEAEVQFSNGNFNGALTKFEQYLQRFPEGKYSLEALYYKSEIYYNRKDWAKAAPGYELVADRVPNKFGEKSLLQAARLNFFDLKDYAKAEKYFTKLKDFATTQENKMEAMRGLLRSQYQLQKWTEATANAKDLLTQKNLSNDDKVLANMAIARSYMVNNQCDQAITYLRTVISLSKAAYGAEARYEIANCYFKQNQFKDAEKAAFEVINKSGSYEEWVTRAYILLGDIYYQQKDYFNAKATYQSVVDNARIEALRTEAKARLDKVIAEEGQNSKVDGE
ncbi:MAG TPA: tetratricopeptide repeat protein [Chitinophagaceae bacterium]|nr:tetratricopeptide repeat protein [Chitinophagaceae bacterium]